MFKTIVATASTALVVLAFGASAQAGGTRGTGGINGISLNGIHVNGMSVNGWSNALSNNGTVMGTTTFAIESIELPATAR